MKKDLSLVRYEQDIEVIKKLVKVAEPTKTQAYYDRLWEEMKNRGSVQSRKNSKRYAEERRY